MIFTPHAYQDRAIQWIHTHPSCALFLDMGLGKTIITLTALSDMLMTGEATRVLVIAPLRVAQDTWSRELAKWDHLSHLRLSKVLGTEAQRLAGLQAPADIYVINRENVDWLVSQTPKGKWAFDTVVIDELSSFKSPSSQRFKALKKVLHLVRHLIGLTGTPSPNGLLDLWSQIYLLDMGARLGRKIGEYQQTYFNPGLKVHNVTVNWRPKKGAADKVYWLLQDLCLSMHSRDYLTLPERIDVERVVELPTLARNRYDELEAEMYLEVGDEVITAGNAAVLTGKLLQAANGAMYNGAGQTVPLHDAKLDALEEIVEFASPLLVFYSYQHDLERILSRFPKARVLKTTEDIAAWNRGDIPVLLAHPASAGHGLNLQDGGHQIVWFGLPWSLELYQQANARLHRQGQRHPVVIHHLLAEDTMDESVLRALRLKGDGQSALLEAVKDRGNSCRRVAGCAGRVSGQG
jgi:hypothetical protein